MTTTNKRTYSSPLREEAARRTRATIRDAARDLFLRHGFANTTMKQVATEAGVAERTVYVAFPSKSALLGEVIGVALAGDDEPRALSERPDFRFDAGVTGPSGVIEQFAATCTSLYERAGAVLVIGEQAAETDESLRPLAEAGAAETLRLVRTLVDSLDEQEVLRTDVRPAQCADSVYALSHFQVHHVLRVRRSWSRRRYQDWLTDTVGRVLLEA